MTVTVSIPQQDFFTGTRISLEPPGVRYPQIVDSSIVPSGQTRYLAWVRLYPNGDVDLGFASSRSSSGSSRADMKDGFETGGFVEVTLTRYNRSIKVYLTGADRTDPYTWRAANAAEVRSFVLWARDRANQAEPSTVTLGIERRVDMEARPIGLKGGIAADLDVVPAVNLDAVLGVSGGATATLEIREEIRVEATVGTGAGWKADLADPTYPWDMEASVRSVFGAQGALGVVNPDRYEVRFGIGAGFAGRLSVTQARPPDPNTTEMFGWLIEILNLSDGPFRIWSGEGTLDFLGHRWEGTTGSRGAIARIEPLTNDVGEPQNRMKFTAAVPPQLVRDVLDIDTGPARTSVRWIYSRDGGVSWQLTPAALFGFLSEPSIEDGLYSVEFETWAGDADRGEPVIWSDEFRKERWPGDRGFEDLRELQGGIESTWPP